MSGAVALPEPDSLSMFSTVCHIGLFMYSAASLGSDIMAVESWVTAPLTLPEIAPTAWSRAPWALVPKFVNMADWLSVTRDKFLLLYRYAPVALISGK